MDDKKFSIFVLVFIFLVAIPSTIFLFSGSGITGQASNEGVLYSWVYDGKEVYVYPNKVIAYNVENPFGTGFYYSSRPVIEKRFDKKMGCPESCYSVRYEDVQDLQNMGFRIDFFGNRLYACWCPGEYLR